MTNYSEKACATGIVESNYFSILPYLKSLQQETRERYGPSARDLIRSLDQECVRVGYVGLRTNPPDQVFQQCPTFMGLETALIAKIKPENVSEVFQLIAEAEYYKPTSQVAQALKTSYLQQLNEKATQRNQSTLLLI